MKKVDVEAREAEEAKATEDAETPEIVAEAVVFEEPAAVVEETTEETVEVAPEAEAEEAAEEPAAESETVEEAVAVEDPEKAEPADPLADLGSKKNDGFKVGDIIRPAPKVKSRPKAKAKAKEQDKDKDKPQAEVSSASVRDSIKAAIQRRKDEAADRETSSRRTRTRKKKKKVDQAEVDRALKQTMAQMDGGPGGKRKRKKVEK